MITLNDVDDLVECGHNIRWPYRKLFYALKDKMLEAYAVEDGYDLQEWNDIGIFTWYDNDPEGVFATHRHILKRYIILDHCFHVPTNEFDYFNYEYQNGKSSEHFSEMFTLCKGKIDGKREKNWDSGKGVPAFNALKRLIKRHGHLLKEGEVNAQVQVVAD